MAVEAGDPASVELSSDEQAWVDRSRDLARRLGAVAAFAVGLGLILVGTGNGIWRLTALGGLDDPRGVFSFLFHLATASTLVVLGASLLPLALHLFSEDEPVSLAKPATLFATLWLVIGIFQMMTGGGSGQAIGGGVVLVLAGLFGLLALNLYRPDRTGPSLSAGVLGLVASGLLLGGVATVPGSITNASRFGAEIVFRYGEAVHVSGYLVATLAATVLPFVRGDARGRAGVALGVALGGLVWGLGEVVFAAWWLGTTPWTLFSSLGAGASVGYAFVLAGGIATVVGGLAVLGACSAWTSARATPLACAFSSDDTPQATVTCDGCEAQAPADGTFCPACGTELTA
ncbi:hypothetical protein BRD56_03425 [Thermoplasmatales archaeon SW_10_69_26]|nr:MAG: hypothetical protein BRD56_03425 [Thermoplasmatales archaeon SW_10_69_26]